MAASDASEIPPGRTDSVLGAGAPSFETEFERAPDVPAQAREDLVALKSGGLFVCTRIDGDIRPARASGQGFYAHDTRHLSELRLTCGGANPVLLSSAIESGHHAVIHATNPSLPLRGGETVAQETLDIHRTLLIGDRLFSRVTVRSYCRAPVTTLLGLSLAADFADVFEVRGVDRRTSGTMLAPKAEDGGLRFGYVAADGLRRETLVELTPAPARISVDGGRARVAWDLELDAGAAAAFQITVTPLSPESAPGRRSPTRGPDAETMERTAARAAAAHDEWVGECAHITSDRPLFDRLIDASVRDLHALMMPVGNGRLPAAGIPWYVAPFGRDSLLTASASLMINPEVARDTLLVLANLQAEVDEAWRDAEPGKILHELRTGELARTGHIPHTPYYGTVDATPLFLMVAGGYFRWTLDLETMRQLRPAFDAALEWIDRWATATATDSWSTSAVPRRARSTTAGRTHTTRLSTVTARWPRARSRSSRSRGTCTRPSDASPTSMTLWGTRHEPHDCAMRPGRYAPRSTRPSGTPRSSSSRSPSTAPSGRSPA